MHDTVTPSQCAVKTQRHIFRAAGRPHIAEMPLDLTEQEQQALVRLLRRTLDNERFPMAPRLDPPKSILAKLDPPAPRAPLPPPLRPSLAPTHGQGRRRR